LVQDALRSAQRDGIRISWSGVEASGFHVTLESFGAWIPGPTIKNTLRAPIKIDLENARIYLDPLSILRLDPSIEFSVEAYGGAVSGTVSSVLNGPKLSAELASIDLGRHPQLRPLGLATALLSGSIRELQTSASSVTSGTFNLAMERMEFPEIGQWVPLVKLAPLVDGSIKVRGRVDSSSVFIDDLSLQSPYGHALGSCEARNIDGAGAPSAHGSFKVTISQTLQQQIGPFLPVLSGNRLSATTEEFGVTMKGARCRPGAGVLGEIPLGSLCVRFIPSSIAPAA
jgi:hypothetical protein